MITVARSWRVFGQQQTIGLLSLYKKIHWMNPVFHLNINEDVDDDCLEYLYNFVPRENVYIYSDNFFDEYARLNEVDESLIQQFSKWKWIYHILLYYYLYSEIDIPYILTYDDDILFNEKEIHEVLGLLEKEIPFGIGEPNGFADKTMLGKLSIYFQDKFDINYMFWSCWPQEFSINSGFMGIRTEFFNHYDSLIDICNLFNYEEYIHTDSPTFDSLFNKLLQEQSFLSINNKSFYNDEYVTLTPDDGYDIRWDEIDENYSNKTKVEHYVHTKKYTKIYQYRLKSELQRFDELLMEGKFVDKFYD